MGSAHPDFSNSGELPNPENVKTFVRYNNIVIIYSYNLGGEV